MRTATGAGRGGEGQYRHDDLAAQSETDGYTLLLKSAASARDQSESLQAALLQDARLSCRSRWWASVPQVVIVRKELRQIRQGSLSLCEGQSWQGDLWQAAGKRRDPASHGMMFSDDRHDNGASARIRGEKISCNSTTFGRGRPATSMYRRQCAAAAPVLYRDGGCLKNVWPPQTRGHVMRTLAGDPGPRPRARHAGVVVDRLVWIGRGPPKLPAALAAANRRGRIEIIRTTGRAGALPRRPVSSSCQQVRPKMAAFIKEEEQAPSAGPR